MDTDQLEYTWEEILANGLEQFHARGEWQPGAAA